MKRRVDVVVAVTAAVALILVGCAKENIGQPVAQPSTTSASATPLVTTSASAIATTPSQTPSTTSATSSPTATSASPTSHTSSGSPHRSKTPVTQPPLGTNVDCGKVACVALTFDDGPGTQAASLVRTLTDARTPATFFMLSSVAANNKAGAAAVGNNLYMEVGNHSISHPNLTTLGASAQQRQIVTSQQRLEAQTGRKVTLFRPPYGSWNGSVRKIAAKSGQSLILWNVDTLDWKHRNSAKVVSTAMSEVRPGSIVLMHDIHPTTVAAVPNLIVALNKAGYTLVTVSTLLGNPVPGKVYSGR